MSHTPAPWEFSNLQRFDPHSAQQWTRDFGGVDASMVDLSVHNYGSSFGTEAGNLVAPSVYSASVQPSHSIGHSASEGAMLASESFDIDTQAVLIWEQYASILEQFEKQLELRAASYEFRRYCHGLMRGNHDSESVFVSGDSPIVSVLLPASVPPNASVLETVKRRASAKMAELCNEVEVEEDDQARIEWSDVVRDLDLKPAQLATLAQRYFLYSLDLHSEQDVALPPTSETSTHQYYTIPIDGRADGRRTPLDQPLQIALSALTAQGVYLGQNNDEQAHIITHFTNVKLHRILSRGIIAFIKRYPSLADAYRLPDRILPRTALINPALRSKLYWYSRVTGYYDRRVYMKDKYISDLRVALNGLIGFLSHTDEATGHRRILRTLTGDLFYVAQGIDAVLDSGIAYFPKGHHYMMRVPDQSQRIAPGTRGSRLLYQASGLSVETGEAPPGPESSSNDNQVPTQQSFQDAFQAKLDSPSEPGPSQSFRGRYRHTAYTSTSRTRSDTLVADGSVGTSSVSGSASTSGRGGSQKKKNTHG